MRQVIVGEKEGRWIGEGRWISACKEEMFELIRRHLNIYYQGGKKCSLDFQVFQIQMRELCPWYWQYLGDLFLRSRHHLIDISLTYDWNSSNGYVRYDLGTVLGSEGYNDLKKVLISNTSLTVSGAFTHRLPQHTFKIQNGSRGLQRVITIVYWVLWITFAK